MYFLICAILGVLLRVLNKDNASIELKHKLLLYITLIINLGYRITSQFIDINILLISIEISSLLLIIIFLYVNKQYVGILITGIGYISNLVVMLFNNGKMPVVTNITQLDYRHIPITEATTFKLLSDIISLPYPLNIGMGMSSIGDLIIGIGIMLVIRVL